MVTGALIATETLAAVAAEAAAHPGLETCGLLLGEGDRITAHLPARNVATDPRRRFEIDPATLLATYRAQRHGGPAILGCYHSHPTGSPEPSARDAADAAPNGWLWLILGGGAALLWRASAGGTVHGRFDPVPFTCAGAADASESALSSRGTA